MSQLPETCDGFNVTHFCSAKSRACLTGSCWHMDRVRQMVRRWFAPLGPSPRLGWVPKPPADLPPRKLTKAEVEDYAQCSHVAAIVRSRRAAAWREQFERRWAGVPARLWLYRDTGGGMSITPDEDGTGSWGRTVRIVEDSR